MATTSMFFFIHLYIYPRCSANSAPEGLWLNKCVEHQGQKGSSNSPKPEDSVWCRFFWRRKTHQFLVGGWVPHPFEIICKSQKWLSSSSPSFRVTVPTYLKFHHLDLDHRSLNLAKNGRSPQEKPSTIKTKQNR